MAQTKQLPETDRIDAVRRFNRFYTQKIGVLQSGLLDSAFSLTEGRVLYELAHRKNTTASDLIRDLGLDAGYLSRILRRFKKSGYVTKTRSDVDGRQSHLAFTPKGLEAFRPLDRRSHDQIFGLLKSLPASEQDRLVKSMETIEALLSPRASSPTPYSLRPHRPGDIGWVVHRHGVLYAQEYGFDETFEALVADICAQFIRSYDAKRARCWIAEKDGEIVGSVFMVKQSAKVTKLRLLLVEPKARGLGIGHKLIDECITFARFAGYRKITLWTNNVLHAARHLYEDGGFIMRGQERHHSFGKELIGETWELEL